ncbi:hypothetical protein RhiJN_03164 [Ceratobasidium sp. AG-Ba]|nr:hypothetical protein RhiJN_03164 [Ceratobasidium sp. AG-Ba]
MAIDDGDHSDLDSLFGDGLSDNETQNLQPSRAVISFPRVAVASQNVGTIAPSPVLSSSEHHSSGSLSSASIPLTRDSVQPSSKRNAPPVADQPNKRRRVESDDSASNKIRAARELAGKPADLRRAVLQKRALTSGSDAFGLSGSTDRVARAEALQTVLGMLAPRTKPQARSRAPKVINRTDDSASGVSGTGTATDPVLIPDDTASSADATNTKKSGQPSTSRRITRSQEAHALLEALPNDPKDILSQTLRTILKTPTTITHSRNTTPRDIATYLANGRHTGTPFLRLLRHLAGPNRLKDPKYGLEQLKKLVDGMRMTEVASKQTAMSSQPSTSAASTPMPATPNTPAVTSFPVSETSMTANPPELAFSPDLFSLPDFGFNPSIGTHLDLNKQQPDPDIVIDPQLLAISQDQSYLQSMQSDMQNVEFNLEELFGALPAPPTPNPLANPTDATDTINFTWDDLPPIPLNSDNWCPQSVVPTPEPTIAVHRPFKHANQVTQLVPKQADLPPGGIRIPPKSEALALLERARARKDEIEAKLKSARRQVWGCTVETAVERNLLSKLTEKR